MNAARRAVRLPGGMSDVAVVAAAASSAGGAAWARPVPLAAAAAAVVVALLVRRPSLLCVGLALLASGLGARAWAGLDPPAPAPVDATVALASDPVDVPPAVRAVARLGDRRVEVWARGDAAARLRAALTGERVRVVGTLSPVAPEHRRRLALQHVTGHLSATDIGPPVPARHVHERLANRARRALGRVAAALPERHRPLFTGLVIGDDRGQAPELVDDFRASGLGHLLVVSGGNVAFVLAVAGPFLRRASLAWRLVPGLAVLAGFGVLTRWEPSVLRAVAMAGIALGGDVAGRPQPATRRLALAVVAVVLVDPLLVWSLGFRLSVAASTGLAVLAGPLARALPGPRPLAVALGATIAAQLAVAPLLLATFGPVPLAAIPANVLAVPAAGAAMVLGLALALPAGVVGGPLVDVAAAAVRVPVVWIAAVARAGAALPIPAVGTTALAALVAGGAVAACGARRGRPRLRSVGLGACALSFAAVALAPPPPTGLAGSQVARGLRVWRDGDATVVALGDADSASALGALRSARIRHPAVLVGGSSPRAAAALAAVLRRHRPRILLAPPDPLPAGAVAARAGTVVRAGRLVVEIVVGGRRPVVRVTRGS